MKPHLRGVLLLILVTAIWGSTFAVVKTLTGLLPPAVLIAWRFLVAALGLLPMVWWQSRSRRRRSQQGRHQSRHQGSRGASGMVRETAPTAQLWRDGLILGAWLIAGYGTQTVALQTTGANRAAFFTALSVVLVPLWLTLVQRRRMPGVLWLALPLAVAGLALLSWEGGRLVVGDAWALACAFTYAGFIVALEKMAHRHTALPFTLAQVLSVTALAWVWALGSSPQHLWPVPAAWGPLLYLGLLATAFTTLLQTLGQRQVSAAEASVIYALEPVAATVFSFFLIHEQVGWRGLLGGLLVVAATILSSRAETSAPVGAQSDAQAESVHPEAPTPGV